MSDVGASPAPIEVGVVLAPRRTERGLHLGRSTVSGVAGEVLVVPMSSLRYARFAAVTAPAENPPTAISVRVDAVRGRVLADPPHRGLRVLLRGEDVAAALRVPLLPDRVVRRPRCPAPTGRGSAAGCVAVPVPTSVVSVRYSTENPT